MRGAILAVVAVVGCQHVPTAPLPALGGGVVPASYAVRSAERGDAPAVLTTPTAAAFRRVSDSRRSPRPESVPLGHAADYGWIVGVLAHDGGVWSIRYGGSGDLDRHGGALELLNTGPMDGFWPGRLVRVEGELVDPAPLEVRPGYRVRALHLVGR
jgi:hypothetical protein